MWSLGDNIRFERNARQMMSGEQRESSNKRMEYLKNSWAIDFVERRPDSMLARQAINNIDDYMENPTDLECYEKRINYLDTYFTNRIQRERHRKGDYAQPVINNDYFSLDLSDANERWYSYCQKGMGNSLMRRTILRHLVVDDEKQHEVNGLASHLLEDVFTYVGSNEGWFGERSFILETSRNNKVDDLGPNKVDALLETRLTSGETIYFGVDITISKSENIIKKKVLGNLTSGGEREGSVDRVKKSTALCLTESPIHGLGPNAVNFVPIVLCLSPENTRSLIDSLYNQFKNDELMDELALHNFDETGLRGVTKGYPPDRLPIIRLFSDQIISQLNAYEVALSSMNLNATQRKRLSDIKNGIKYFKNLKNEIKPCQAINDESSNILFSIIDRV